MISGNLLTRFFSATSDICEGLCTSESTGLPNVTADSNQVQQVLQIVFAVIGVVALIFVIIGGIQFITSQGDPQSATRGRQTVIYAVIGLVIALAAEALVIFVLGKL